MSTVLVFLAGVATAFLLSAALGLIVMRFAKPQDDPAADELWSEPWPPADVPTPRHPDGDPQ